MKYGRKHPKVLRSPCPPLTTWTAFRLSLSHLFTGKYMLWASTAWKNNWFLNYCGSESLTDGWLDLGSPILKPPELFLGKRVLWVSRGKLHGPVWSVFPPLLVLINTHRPWWSHNVHTKVWSSNAPSDCSPPGSQRCRSFHAEVGSMIFPSIPHLILFPRSQSSKVHPRSQLHLTRGS